MLSAVVVSSYYHFYSLYTCIHICHEHDFGVTFETNGFMKICNDGCIFCW